MTARSGEDRQRGIVEESFVHALVGERASLVHHAFFNWKPVDGLEEWRDVVSLLLLEDKMSSAVLNVLETEL